LVALRSDLQELLFHLELQLHQLEEVSPELEP
jgi:hypothetical protein